MRYYNKRFAIKHSSHQQLPQDSKDETVYIRSSEAETMLSKMRGKYDDAKIDYIVRKIRDGSINMTKNRARRTVYIQGAPIIHRDLLREMFPEYSVEFP